MRKTENINDGWKFIKADASITSILQQDGEAVNLPHTWNGTDGQDGGNDYVRAAYWYVRTLKKPQIENEGKAYLEFKGVNASAEVYVNGQHVITHHGGYSTFRKDITSFLQEENTIAVRVSNEKTEKVYPQTADFTFYGGIYRDVNIITVSKNHFDLDFFGACGLKIAPTVEDKNGVAKVRAFVAGKGRLKVNITDADGMEVAQADGDSIIDEALLLKVADVHLWNGVLDPYLYTVKAQLIAADGAVEDVVTQAVGFRTFTIDANDGFYLNGKKYPLRGVCRHQDRPKIGNALNKQHHEEDMRLISEVGANTVRLAHYQHDDYFYDLCDRYGMVVWAEIPYISRHMNPADENALSQMQELIYQQYNHPSIVCWGLSNEITMHRADEDRFEFHKVLNALCKKLDNTRKTVIACYMPCLNGNKLNRIPDLVSYNLYFGWYFPVTALAAWKLDGYHKKYKNQPIGLAEYGAEAMPNVHSIHPRRGDNTEEYQAIYHERMLKIIEKRDYIWATHVWNMFDFAADARDQGGEAGMNHKGLVTFDRKIKKDSFYLYKAYWARETFVHLCGKRFVNRTGKTATVKVYSNATQVQLFQNDVLIGQKEGHCVFEFKITLQNNNALKAVAGNASDNSLIVKVSKTDKAYKLRKTKNKSWEK